ncbi:hypothetical protein V6Z11_A09G254800 [Gossypium hirsutum]
MSGLPSNQKAKANTLLGLMHSFEFVFSLHLMRHVLRITNNLSEALQRKYKDIVNVILLHDIDVPNMDDDFVDRGRSRRKAHKVTNMHYYRVEIFYTIIDIQLQELNICFNEVNTKLLLCKLICLYQIYSSDFSPVKFLALDNQLETYIIDMNSRSCYKKMVDKKNNIAYPLVYCLVKLALILLVVTTSVERVFSTMKIVKNRLKNRIGDQWMNGCLITYAKKYIFNNIDKEKIIQLFQHMIKHSRKL